MLEDGKYDVLVQDSHNFQFYNLQELDDKLDIALEYDGCEE